MRHFCLLALALIQLLLIAPTHSQSEPECKCILNNLYLDVYIVIDDSAQMGSAGLTEVAANINSVFGFSQIRVGDQYANSRGVRTAVITYNSHSRIRSNLSDFQSADELTKMVYSLEPSKDYTSNLAEPLEYVQVMMRYTDRNAPRSNTRTVVLIYAADYMDFDQPTIRDIGEGLKSKGVVIITVADITRNDNNQIGKLAGLASPNDHFNVNDDYVSEEVQQAFCRANCFCPQSYHQFGVQTNSSTHQYGSCVQYVMEPKSWLNAKFACQNLHQNGYLATEFSAEKHAFNKNLFQSLSTNSNPSQYHVGLHFVNNGYYWEQPAGLPLVPLVQSLYPLDPRPKSNAQCVSNSENMTTTEEYWDNVDCLNESRPYLCEVAACDTENLCS